jgi:hypothetical protein
VVDDYDGRSAAPLFDALHASDLRAKRALCYLTDYDMNHSRLERRAAFLGKIGAGLKQ